MNMKTFDVEKEVLRRYDNGAREREAGLCCPSLKYDNKYLELLPAEILDKDYGCGDPSVYAREGDTVLDLGSGGGKVCYILSQKVGNPGRVIGVDFNDEMLKLSRKYIPEMAEKLGYSNVCFYKARIQDLALDLDKVNLFLNSNPVSSVDSLSDFEAECRRLKKEETLVPDESIDLVVSNCVLNLVRPQDKEQLFSEIHRVLKRGGRAIISDIVSDEDPTQSILNDPELWSGCISGAFREDRFIEMFERAGFYAVEILKSDDNPWQTIDGIEFRSVTLRAYKGLDGPCLERNQAVMYKGPWKMVTDDDGHRLYRGKRIAVCDKTFKILTGQGGPYHKDVIPIEPLDEIPVENAGDFDCSRNNIRHPRETKGMDYNVTDKPADDSCCGPDCC